MDEVLNNKSEDLWSSYKELRNVIWRHLSKERDDVSLPEFKNILRNYKQNFFALLQNQPKSAKSREELKKGMEEGINIKGIGHQILSKELYQETVILSDMFDMNEFVALDLLCTAQLEMHFHPNLSRGLVAILLYYEGRKSLLISLRYLVQARSGVQWKMDINADSENFITQYTDQLMEGGLFNRIFDLLHNLDKSREIDLLQENRALGDAKHRRQVIDLFEDIRLILADIVFMWSTQSGLPKNPTLSLINYLRNIEVVEEASGKLDNVNLYLLMALLAALDLSVLHSKEDGEEAVEKLPIISEPGYIEAIVNELNIKNKWKNSGLEACANLGLAICLTSLQYIIQRSNNENENIENVVDQADDFVDFAIELNVFEFLYNTVIVEENSLLFTEEYLYKRMHHLLSDFIVNLYSKVKELRIKADEIARTVQIYAREGLEAPTHLPRYFEFFLMTIGKFYAGDKLNREYNLEFWTSTTSEENNWSQSSINLFKSNIIPSRSVTLFKFLRLAGDKLPPTLFVPYIKMLSGLANGPKAARHCFNLLKQQNLQSTLSWDHFFASFTQYYNSLRLETPVAAAPAINITTATANRGGVYRSSSYVKGVSPQELDGLHAVLLLIRTIADSDEFARLAFSEHPVWAPLVVLLGLVSCSVPIPFKADLLKTLASLSRSAISSTQMWENLEAAQILITIPTTSNYTPRGIQTELDEIETRIEEYPLTRAFLELLDALTDFGIPRSLGAGLRSPGFDPYLSFIIHSVFIKIHTRPYRNPSEKWQVAALCLKLFEKFLSIYEPNVEDFPKISSAPAANDFNSPPGYHLMIQLNNKSETLNLLLDLIDEGNHFFSEFVLLKEQNQRFIESSILHVFNILNVALSLETRFFNTLANSNAPVLLTNLSKLLLTINRKSNCPDHCINILNYVSFYPYLVKHGLAAIKILINILNSPLLHNQFINLFLISDKKINIKNGFVFYMDCGDIEDHNEDLTKIKLQIIKLLKECLNYNAPNLSHYLLGFDLKKAISKTEFQYSGVMVDDLQRNCLNSLLSLVQSQINKEKTTDWQLLEAAYEMIFLLTSNGTTSKPVLRFLRLYKSFFMNHLITCYRKLLQQVNCLNQTSYLMKILAIELKMVSGLKQIHYLKQLINFLVNVPSLESDTSQNFFNLTPVPENRLNYIVDADNEQLPTSLLENLQENFMIKLIAFFDKQPSRINQPSWQCFNTKNLEKTFQNCYLGSSKLIDIKKLHQTLYDELKQLQTTTYLAKIQAISQEIPNVLKYALDLNKYQENCNAIVHFVDAWRQLVGVIMITTPKEVLTSKQLQVVGIAFVLNLLKKLNKMDILTEVGQLISATILITLNSIKKHNKYEMKLKRVYNTTTTTTTNNKTCVLEMHAGSLNEILMNLFEWVLCSNQTDEKLRMNLYASLVTILESNSSAASEEETMRSNLSFVVADDEESKWSGLKISAINLNKFGEKLVETLCRDSIAGNDATKLLALSTISTLIRLSGHYDWIKYLSARGYLKFIIQSILDSNNDLERLLEADRSQKSLYIYKAKMLFLCRLSGTRLGAELLLEHQILGTLATMNIFHSHPEIQKTQQQQQQQQEMPKFLPNPSDNYLQIWLPVFKLSNAFLTMMGVDNLNVVKQIIHFVLQKFDIIELILRSGSIELKLENLKELDLITLILARISFNDLQEILENNNDAVQIYRGHLHRLQKLLFTLIARFLLNNSIIKLISTDRLLYVLRIMSNLLLYCKNLTDYQGVLFQPTFEQFSTTTTLVINQKQAGTSSYSISLIIQQLVEIVNYHQEQKNSLNMISRKLRDINIMDNNELNELLIEIETFNSTKINKQQQQQQLPTDINHKRQFVYDLLRNQVIRSEEGIDYANIIIDMSIYLIWFHLDYYMLKTIPKMSYFGIGDASDSVLADATEATWKVSTDDLSKLKHGLIAIFNETFIKTLNSTIQDRSNMDKTYVETLLRKIIRLIQFVPVK